MKTITIRKKPKTKKGEHTKLEYVLPNSMSGNAFYWFKRKYSALISDFKSDKKKTQISISYQDE